MQSSCTNQIITLSNTAASSRATIHNARMEELVEGMLNEIGEDPTREGLQKTPHRVAKAMEILTGGYRKDIDTVLNGAIVNDK